MKRNETGRSCKMNAYTMAYLCFDLWCVLQKKCPILVQNYVTNTAKDVSSDADAKYVCAL